VHPGSLGGKYGPSLEQAVDFESVERELVEELKQLKPNVILVGMGFPLQEKLMAKLTPQLGHGVLIGEGGTFDYDSFGGNRSKAPTWMQKSGLEWLWRLVLEPRRIVRQMAIPRFMWAVYRNSKSKSAADYSKSK
jgi:N-acetylglucosaminyldiphosphoundecaprenol N-acetyl-beta-D-mannosaminyltransferase